MSQGRTVWLALAAAGLLAISCGPGFEAMHESNLRFEHCYRLDMDSKIAPSHREHCWRDWTEIYARGQPLDRVEYARRRITEIESGDGRVMSLDQDPPAEQRLFEETAPDAPMAAPAPTSAHEPPPKTAPAPAPGSGHPGARCAEQCDQTLGDCSRLCEAKQADCATCREDYRACMRRCYE